MAIKRNSTHPAGKMVDPHIGHDFSPKINEKFRRYASPGGKAGAYVVDGQVFVGGKQSYNGSKSGFGVGTDKSGKHAGTGLRNAIKGRISGSAKDASKSTHGSTYK